MQQRAEAAWDCLLAALQREEHWPAAGQPQEEGWLATEPREVAQECSRGVRPRDCSLVESQPPVVLR